MNRKTDLWLTLALVFIAGALALAAVTLAVPAHTTDPGVCPVPEARP